MRPACLVGKPYRPQNAGPSLDGIRQQIVRHITGCKARVWTRSRVNQEREYKKQIHQRSGSGDENLIPAATGVGSAVVSTAQTQPELPHRNSKYYCGQHVTHLVEQQASCERSSDCEAKPQSRKLDAKEEAKRQVEAIPYRASGTEP